MPIRALEWKPSLPALFALIAAIVLTSCTRLTGAPSNSPSTSLAGNETAVPSSAAFTARLDNAASVQIASLSDCEQLSDRWLHGLCAKIESFSPAGMPSTGEDLQALSKTGDVEQTMDAAYAWFMLRGDTSFCSYESVQIWVSVGMHAKDGEQACLDAMANVRKQGIMGITNPRGGQNLEVQLDASPSSSLSAP